MFICLDCLLFRIYENTDTFLCSKIYLLFAHRLVLQICHLAVEESVLALLDGQNGGGGGPAVERGEDGGLGKSF